MFEDELFGFIEPKMFLKLILQWVELKQNSLFSLKCNCWIYLLTHKALY